MQFLLSSFSWLDSFIFLNLLLVFSVIFLEHKNASATWAWIMLMLFIPILGFILYMLVGQDLRKRKTFKKKVEEDHFLALVHRQQSDLSLHIDEYCNPLINSYKDLINLHLTAHEALYTEDNEVNIFTDGNCLFKDLFESIKSAKNYIHLEYYIIRDDDIGKSLKELLIAKAKAGVKVALVYDDMGCFSFTKRFFKDLKKAGIEVDCFFPAFFPFLKTRANYRNHRKMCIVDGNIAYIGGYNIGKEYLGLDPKFGYWRDTHLKIQGSSVGLINLQFLLDRRFALNENFSLEEYFPTMTPLNRCAAGLQIVSSGPDSKHPSIYHGFIEMIHAAKQYIYLQTPYFIPDEAVLTALKLAALSGKDVRIMIPNKPDHLFVYWATYSNIGQLLESGVRCFTYENGFLHAKTIVIDGEVCSVGSANFDVRSFKLNFEINAFIYDARISKQLTHFYFEDLKYCKELTLEQYQHRCLKIRFKESISRLISPIL